MAVDACLRFRAHAASRDQGQGRRMRGFELESDSASAVETALIADVLQRGEAQAQALTQVMTPSCKMISVVTQHLSGRLRR